MYKSIRIQNYRGIEDLTINDLGRVNLIVGANNVGKTSVLEALALLRAHADGYELKQILEARGYVEGESESGAISSMFGQSSFSEYMIEASDLDAVTHRLLGVHSLDWSQALDRHSLRSTGSMTAYDIELDFPNEHLGLIYNSTSIDPNQGFIRRELRLSLEPVKSFPAKKDRGIFGEVAFVPSSPRIRNRLLPEFLTDARRRGELAPIVGALQDFDGRIRDVSVAAAYGKTSIDVELSGPGNQFVSLPWTAVGDGIRRLWEMLVVLPRAASGIGIVDEVDTGIYYENLPKVWRALNRIRIDSDLQLFLTTHSLECVENAVDVFQELDIEGFRLHRLERIDGKISVTTYHLDDLAQTRELNWEFR